MIRISRIKTFLLSLLLLSAVGCAGGNQDRPADYVSDSWITTKVKSSIAADPAVKATEVNVETLKGEVQLSGFVSSYAAMNKAVEIARGIQGVRTVKNDMRIKQ